VRPILEYGGVVWAPVYVAGIAKLQGVQRYFSKKIHGLGNITYSQRLTHLDPKSLHHRRLTSDMVFLFKIMTGETIIDMNGHLQIREPGITRGHSLCIEMPVVEHVATKWYFLSRVAEPWNKMPSKLLDCRSDDSFRHGLLTHIADPYTLKCRQ